MSQVKAKGKAKGKELKEGEKEEKKTKELKEEKKDPELILSPTKNRKNPCCDKFDGRYKTEYIEEQHKTKAVCAYCGKYIKWLENPKTTEACEERNKRIEKILEKILKDKEKRKELTDKTITFLTDIQSHRFLTPRQHEYLDSIFLKFPNI